MIRALQKNRIFAFLASVKLAVPLMLTLGVAVAAGTVYEARYNAQVAGMMIYRAWWFLALMGLLWINIFASTVARWPFKIHHTGFVITHLGLLTLLAGAQITAFFGIDGQLRVVEGATSNTVVVPDLVIQWAKLGTNQVLTEAIPRALTRRDHLNLSPFERSTGLKVERFLPFVSVQQGFSADGPGGEVVRFKLQSPFFNVEESLHSAQRPEIQLGPARIRLFRDMRQRGDRIHRERNLIVKKSSNGETLAILKIKAGAVLPTTQVGTSRIQITRIFESAKVSGGKLIESGEVGGNPAVEFRITTGTTTIREVAFARFPGFKLQPKATPSLLFEYSPGTPSAESAGLLAGTDRRGNVVEFHAAGDDLRIELYKNGARVLAQPARVGDTVQTPWMGMKISILDFLDGKQVTGGAVTPVELTPKADLPPSALLIGSTWIPEGEVKTIQNTASGEKFEVYFGFRSIDLPFSLLLQEFWKKDYPGTETAMSFQSTVLINGRGDPVTIKMNEPLERAGFKIYQSSYEMGQGRPTASIFSVNRDPGRFVKYAGAIILSLGIVIFTLMRSRLYRHRATRLMEKSI